MPPSRRRGQACLCTAASQCLTKPPTSLPAPRTTETSYGAGSSGSVVAAVYDRFSTSKKDLSLSDLKETFARIESFFHGSSSGLDPLVSYLDSAIYILNGEVATAHLSSNSILSKLYLFDTTKSRSTSKLVSWYKSQLQYPDFIRNVSDQMTKVSSEIIKALQAQDEKLFERLFKSLSEIQHKNLSPMFPEEILKKLERITKMQGGFFKLCGAGGGGYFLAYLPDYDSKDIPEDLSKAITPIL